MVLFPDLEEMKGRLLWEEQKQHLSDFCVIKEKVHRLALLCCDHHIYQLMQQ